jgi:cyanophycinase
MKNLVVKRIFYLIILTGLLAATSCSFTDNHPKKTGKLFIIGGGDKGEKLMNELVTLAGLGKDDYVFVLPMAGAEPDSSIIWARQDFGAAGVRKVSGYNFVKGEVPPEDKLDSLQKAKLIYISGGDQSRFMEVVKNSPIKEAIFTAYSHGAVISGTSAGAAVMSRKMITGNQKKHPDIEGSFQTIEADNIEIIDGLGLLGNVIVDQHFIKRQRLNRLVAASAENPDQLCVGIDESTAIIVDGNRARVTGKSQVVVIKNPGSDAMVQNGLLGKENLKLSVYLPGQSFNLRW